VFRKGSSKYEFTSVYYDQNSYTINQWEYDPNPSVDIVISRSRGNRYPSGFHIFTRKKGAQQWAMCNDDLVVKPVLFRKVVATGYQGHAVKENRSAIAKQIKILQENKIQRSKRTERH
jgi:hypothetical protein